MGQPFFSPFSLLPSPFSLLPSPFSLLPSPFSSTCFRRGATHQPLPETVLGHVGVWLGAILLVATHKTPFRSGSVAVECVAVVRISVNCFCDDESASSDVDDGVGGGLFQG